MEGIRNSEFSSFYSKLKQNRTSICIQTVQVNAIKTFLFSSSKQQSQDIICRCIGNILLRCPAAVIRHRSGGWDCSWLQLLQRPIHPTATAQPGPGQLQGNMGKYQYAWDINFLGRENLCKTMRLTNFFVSQTIDTSIRTFESSIVHNGPIEDGFSPVKNHFIGRVNILFRHTLYLFSVQVLTRQTNNSNFPKLSTLKVSPVWCFKEWYLNLTFYIGIIIC